MLVSDGKVSKSKDDQKWHHLNKETALNIVLSVLQVVVEPPCFPKIQPLSLQNQSKLK